MKFKVVSNIPSDRVKQTFYLVEDNWDDWFEFQTTFILKYSDREKNVHIIGTVKIGCRSQSGRTPGIPKNFEQLDESFFSVGQDESYYSNLTKLLDIERENILNALNDLALKQDLFEQVRLERVVQKSLLRDINVKTLKGQFQRLARGGARLTPYDFEYSAPYLNVDGNELKITFKVMPESNPPTSIHVLIGRNGVGKTHLMSSMVYSLISSEKTSKYGKFSANIFTNLVLVSFSAFDQKYPVENIEAKEEEGLNYSYIGLSDVPKPGKRLTTLKSQLKLKNEFVNSALNVCFGEKSKRWTRALTILESDLIFKEASISKLLEIDGQEDFKQNASKLFEKLSSGHKIVLLTITKLVDVVQEKSLIMLDEPEGHLHPPLLAAFIRALSNLLVERNGVAIVATHSPVVLQEVPRSCVWKISRSGSLTKLERLSKESFGENISILTGEVFGLELTQSGYHKLLAQVVEKFNTYEEALMHFDNQIGDEGRAILRSLFDMKNENMEF